MSAAKIHIWYNQEISEPAAFADLFRDDLQKCLTRFGVPGDVSINPVREGKEEDFNIIVLTKEDGYSATFIERCKKLAAGSPSLLVIIEPADNIPADLLSSAQPMLFWGRLHATGETRVFRRDMALSQASYWEKITDIVTGLGRRSADRRGGPLRDRVYLSQVDISHNSDRESIKRDLNDLGYDVVPENMLTSNISDCTLAIKSALEGTRLIIHIIPHEYIPFFANQHLSLSEHQCNITAAFIAEDNPGIRRILWISSSFEITDEENQIFIEKLQRDTVQTRQTTVLRSNIEELKKHYRDISGGSVGKSMAEPVEPDVYFIFDINSNGLFGNIMDSFGESKLNIRANTGGITYNQHLSMLAAASIAVLVYSDENEEWLRVKTRDILKSRGMDYFRPFEKIVLVKGDAVVNTGKYESDFTHVLQDPEELPSLLSDNQTKKV